MAASTAPTYTPVAEVPGIVAATRAAFNRGVSRPMEWRVRQLRQIRKAMIERKSMIVEALKQDLGRPDFEGVVAETLTVVAECDHTLGHIYEWAKPEKVDTPLLMAPGTSYVQKEPLGVVAIIAPWNFPVQLCFNPLIAALAAGNTAVIKPSEIAPACAVVIERLCREYLDADAVRIVQGGVPETTALLSQRFDHIFYTGNDRIARIVMRAAAEHLTPVTLELGGKSPVIVAPDANLKLAAARIIGNKCLNAGQVCIAPDYVLAHASVVDRLIGHMKDAIRAGYGADVRASPDFGRIVNDFHFKRVRTLLEGAGGTVEAGGDMHEASRFIAPTIIRSPAPDSEIMRQEIFGPLLPVVPVASVDEAIAYVNRGEKPLALYVFSSSSKTQREVLSRTSSGGAVINDCIMHTTNPSLPFGGVGTSGLGAYHGKYGFDALSHRKAIFHQSTLIDNGPLRFAPYSSGKLSLLDFAFRWQSAKLLPFSVGGWKNAIILGLSAAVVVLSLKVTGKLPA